MGALAIAVVSAGIGGAAASVIEHNAQLAAIADGAPGGGATPSLPAGNTPVSTVEQVAAKVVPSVVMLETDLGRQSEEGSGIILSSDGLILTNNHVVATAANPGIVTVRHTGRPTTKVPPTRAPRPSEPQSPISRQWRRWR